MTPLDVRRANKVLDDLKATRQFAPFDDAPIYLIVTRGIDAKPVIKDALVIAMSPGEQDALLQFLLDGQEAELASLGVEAVA